MKLGCVYVYEALLNLEFVHSHVAKSKKTFTMLCREIVHKCNDFKAHLRFQCTLTLIGFKPHRTTYSTSALEQDRKRLGSLLASITSCDVSNSLLKAKETIFGWYQ